MSKINKMPEVNSKCSCETLHVDNVTRPKEISMCDYCSENKNNRSRKPISLYNKYKTWLCSFF